jgi:hypothetical protein
MATEPTTTSGYDHDLQMHVEPEHAIDLNTVRFIKWLVDTSRLEGDTSYD